MFCSIGEPPRLKNAILFAIGNWHITTFFPPLGPFSTWTTIFVTLCHIPYQKDAIIRNVQFWHTLHLVIFTLCLVQSNLRTCPSQKNKRHYTMHSKIQASHSKVSHLNWQNDRLFAGSQRVCNIWCSYSVGKLGVTNINQITAVALLQLLQSCMSQAGFGLWIGRRWGALNTRFPVSYVLHKVKRSLASFEVLAATRVEDAFNLAMETAWYIETSVDCHQATRRRNIDSGLVSCHILSISPCSSSCFLHLIIFLVGIPFSAIFLLPCPTIKEIS